MNKNNRTSGAGIGILEVVLVVNIVLKLVGVIKWSWIAVLWPIWVTVAVFVVLMTIFVIALVFSK